MTLTNTVFISYAREDRRYAERIYMDLRKAEINAWIDTKCLQAGQNWRKEVQRVIRQSAFFIALVSQHSLSKRGYVQKEMKIALNILDEIPSDKIFLIPVKLDKTDPYDEELLNLNWVNLYESYEYGLERILNVIANLDKEPLQYYRPDSTDKKRIPIRYNPFTSFNEFILDLFLKIPTSTDFFAYADNSIYISCITTHDGFIMPDYLRKQYPNEIVLVFQYQFKNLIPHIDHCVVDLRFNDILETLIIPYQAIKMIAFPSIDVIILNNKITNL